MCLCEEARASRHEGILFRGTSTGSTFDFSGCRQTQRLRTHNTGACSTRRGRDTRGQMPRPPRGSTPISSVTAPAASTHRAAHNLRTTTRPQQRADQRPAGHTARCTRRDRLQIPPCSTPKVQLTRHGCLVCVLVVCEIWARSNGNAIRMSTDGVATARPERGKCEAWARQRPGIQSF